MKRSVLRGETPGGLLLEEQNKQARKITSVQKQWYKKIDSFVVRLREGRGGGGGGGGGGVVVV
jgi:hypothetical protein